MRKLKHLFRLYIDALVLIWSTISQIVLVFLRSQTVEVFVLKFFINHGFHDLDSRYSELELQIYLGFQRRSETISS